jgi:hypothetical protein
MLYNISKKLVPYIKKLFKENYHYKFIIKKLKKKQIIR